MRRTKSALCLLVLYAALSGQAAPARAFDGVVASIPPVHSLVASVMKGAGAPHLILRGGGSPHTYALAPSDARALQKATVVFWIGGELERFLEGPLENLPAGKARIVELIATPGLTLHGFRQGGPQKAHGHGHGKIDPHVWLDPVNAKILVGEIVKTLSDADPANAKAYQENARETSARLDALTKQIEATLAPWRSRPFVVFHDAYRYFVERFGLRAAGSVTVSPQTQAGAERVAGIAKRIGELGAVCIFTEPQFEPKLVARIVEDTKARAGVLDPLGAGLAAGPGLYFELMRKNAGAIAGCLQGEG